MNNRSKQKIITINKRLRPIRLGFIIEKGDKKTLRNVFRINTCLWGGIFNAIIPFFKRTPKEWERDRIKLPPPELIIGGYLEAFEPDFLVVRDKKILPNILYDKNRLLTFNDIFDNTREEPIAYGVDITDFYWDLYNKEFKFERRHPIKIFLPQSKRKTSLFSSCCFGEFPQKKESEYIKRNFEYYLNPKKMEVNEATFLSYFVEGWASPLGVGKANLNVSYIGWRADPSLFFMDVNSWLDLVDFWNIRAIGRNVLPLPKQWADNCIDICNKIIKRNFRPYRHNEKIMHYTTFICSRSCEMKEMESFVTKLTSPGSGAISKQHWYPRIWDEWGRDKDHVMRCIVDADERSEEIYERDNYIRFKDISPRFIDKYGGIGKPRWINAINFKDYYHSADFPAIFPTDLQDINHVLGEHGPNEIWMSSEGVNIPCDHAESLHFWKIPTSTRLFEVWLKEKGFSYELSSAGRILLKMIQSVSGFFGISSLKHKAVIELLNKMSHNAVEIEVGIDGDLPQSKVRAKTVPIKQWRDLLIRVNNGSKEIAERHLQNLINYRALRCGINVQCPECMQHTWFGLEDLSEKLICERCLEEFDFPVNKPIPEEDWHYRTIGSFSVENYAQGAYCSALAACFLAHPLSSEITLTPSFILRKNGKKSLETDFGMFLGQKQFGVSSTELIFGECKTYTKFSKRDVNKMSEMAKIFPGAIIAFCTLRDSLEPVEKKYLTKLARMGRKHYRAERWINPVLILTGIELFSDVGPPYCWKDKGKPYDDFANQYRGDGIQELCDITQQMHLGIESYWTWYEQQRQKRMKKRKGKEKNQNIL